jgi:hypothetical protein
VESVKSLLQIFINIVSLRNKEQRVVPLDSVAYRNVVKFVEDLNCVSMILSLLEETDRNVRYLTAKFLTSLISNKPEQILTAVLQSPVGVSRLIDLLRAKVDMIRNEGLLLLLELTKTNQEIQKILAFEGVFDQLFEIMKDEGMANGTIVVQDCLHLIINLLRDNISNQNLFREMGCISKLPPLLELEESDLWLLIESKVEILSLALEVLTVLITGNNPNTYANQTAFKQYKLLDSTMKLALAGVNSPPIRTKALVTLGYMIRGHPENRVVLEAAKFDSELLNKKALPSLVKLVSIVFTSKDSKERKAALFTIQCYLYDNEEGQRALATTITPPPEVTYNDEDSFGRLLLKTLLSWELEEDALRPFYAASILSYILKGNRPVKDLLLRLPLEIGKDQSSIENLLNKTMKALIKSIKTRAPLPIQLGMLRLLTMWLDDCDHAVRLFLQYSDNGNISFWTETMVQSSTNIHVGGLCALLAGLCLPFNDDSTTDRQLAQNVIVTTVGIDKFIDKLDQVRKSEEFSFAQQRRFQILPDDDNKIIYDFDYTLFFNNAYDRIVRRLRPPQNVAANSQTSVNSITQEEHSRIVQNFKDLIREQDRQLSELRRKNEELEKKLQQTTQELSLCKTKGVSSSSNGLGLNSELEKHLRQELENTTKQLEWRTKELTELKKKIEKGGEAPNATELQRLRQENEELQKKVMELKKAKKTLKEKVTTLEDEKRQLRDRLSQMEKQINANNINSSNLEVLSKKVDQLTKELEAAQQKYAALEQEQEELLVCLAKTELANKELKKKLGLPVEDDDDEDKEQQPK